jgi:hypothetical protein
MGQEERQMGWDRPRRWSTLWLPLESRGPAWVASAAVAVVVLLTMSRDLWYFDSAELAIAAVQGGLSHPPGHPLHAVLGFLASHVPGVPPLVGLNALSALAAALTVIPVASLAETMAGPPAPDAPVRSWQRVLSPAAIAVLAVHPVLWENATRIEVYTLAVGLALWSVAFVAGVLTGPEACRKPRRWAAAGLGLGLAAATNPLVAALAAAAAAPGLLTALVRRRIGPAHVVWTLVGLAVGLLPYSYVFLVGTREDVFVWGAPLRGELLWRYLAFADFEQNVGTSHGTFGSNLVEVLGWTITSGVLPIVVIGLAAHLILGARTGLGRGSAPICLGATCAWLASNEVLYPDVSDYQGYLMLPTWLLVAGVAALLARLGTRRSMILTAALGAALATSVALAPPPLFVRTRHRDRVARMLAEGALRSAPPDAIVIVSSDHWGFPLMYLQEVERQRPDVVVLARGLSGASWHWNRIFRQHPDLTRIELRGPGGQPARIRRFRAANPDRPVLFESWEEAREIGDPGCTGPWLLHDRNACPDDAALAAAIPDELTPRVESAVADLGHGEPTAGRVLAKVSLDRGTALWRLGRTTDALRALRAGVPHDVLPPLRSVALDGVPAFSGSLPLWSDGRSIGHYSRNLFVAGNLLWTAGARDDALAHGAAAAAEGLPEALRHTDPSP